MRSINAVLAPGGMAILQPGNDYYDALTIIYNIAKDVSLEYIHNIYFYISI